MQSIPRKNWKKGCLAQDKLKKTEDERRRGRKHQRIGGQNGLGLCGTPLSELEMLRRGNFWAEAQAR